MDRPYALTIFSHHGVSPFGQLPNQYRPKYYRSDDSQKHQQQAYPLQWADGPFARPEFAVALHRAPAQDIRLSFVTTARRPLVEAFHR
jgi:hypothetical protein